MPTASDSLRIQLQVHGGVASFLPGTLLGPRTMSDYELVWMLTGRVRYEADGRRWELRSGDVVLSQPGRRERYECLGSEAARHAFFHFVMEQPSEDLPPRADWPYVFHLGAEEQDVVRPLFRHVVNEGCRGEARLRPASPQISRMIEVIVAALVRDSWTTRPHRQSPYPQPVQLCLDWLGHHLMETPDQPITLDDLAEAASVSPKHLCRLFRESLNVSPVEAARLMRLDRTLNLLARTDLPIKQIADRFGFASSQHYSRCFQQAYGLSPSAARERFRDGDTSLLSARKSPTDALWVDDAW